MKKVLFVSSVTSHINTFHIPYLKWFKEHGYEVHVASKGNEQIPYCDKHYEIPFARFPLNKDNLKAYRELKTIIDENSYEIIHCHTPVGGALARLAGRDAQKNGTRIIYTAHGFHFYKGAPLKNWIIYYPIEKWLAKYTDCLITINSEDYELAKRKFKKCKNIQLVNGVGVNKDKFNINMSQAEKTNLRKSLKLSENDFVLIYVAELSKRKNQILLIEAMKKIVKKNKDVKLLLVGAGSLKEYYQNKINQNNLESNILLLGYHNDIEKLIKISNIYVSTSKQEGLPVNIMEAMSSEIPIIATDCRGNRDLIKNEVNGLLINNNVDELVGAIEKINNKEKIEKFAKNNREIIKKYEIKNVMEEMEKIYISEQKN